MRYIDNFTEEQVKSFYRKVYSFVEAVLIVLITLFSIISMLVLIVLSVIIGVFHLIMGIVIVGYSSKNKL